jgi:spore maturation protein CgeB
MAKLARRDEEYLTKDLISRYGLYLSFTGGGVLDHLERDYGSPRARPLYCSVDPDLYFPEEQEPAWDLGYLGTYSDDRQPVLDRLMLEPARQWPEGLFVVAGPQYPDAIVWPGNVRRTEHIPPPEHRGFYNSQRFTLNVTRAEMVRAGHCPSVRLFEAAACGVPIISDWWEGLDTILQPDEEILISRSPSDTLGYLWDMTEADRRDVGSRARERVLAEHTADHRAAELEAYARELIYTARSV